MADGNCDEKSSCQACTTSDTCNSERKDEHEQDVLRKRMDSIKHKCMVLSGKGGVGKSTVATNVAVTLAMEGFRVGLIDADIHGPNIPKMMGIEDERPSAASEGLLPISTPYGLKVMSIGFFLQSQDDAVIWRGPLKHNLIRQFLGEVHWGEIDFLIVDLPPGTGDEALSVAHLINGVSGAMIVTTPQDVALLDSRKAVTFARHLGIPLVGIVENMSGFTCPHCGKTVNLFKKGGGETAARDLLVPFLGSIPIDQEMVNCGDSGKPMVIALERSAVKDAFKKIVDNWIQLLEGQPGPVNK